MKVHFKGTRGSIPTAYTANEINEKIIAALLAARGKDLRSESQIVEFVQKKLPFRVGSTWEGNTPCIHVDTSSKEILILMVVQVLSPWSGIGVKSGIKNTTFHIFISHLHYDHIQGLPFFIPLTIHPIKSYSTAGTIIWKRV